MNTNAVLNELINAEGTSDITTDNPLYPNTSKNHNTFIKCIKDQVIWNKDNPFPIDKCLTHIKLHQWFYNEFDYETQKLVEEYLPKCMLECFFALKEFRDGSRNELLSTQRAYARLMALPTETQDEKAYVVYRNTFEYAYNEV